MNEREFQIGDVISVNTRFDCHDFKVTKVTPKTATAEENPITLAPGVQTKPFLEPIRMRRTYRINDIKGWKFYKVDFIPAARAALYTKISIRPAGE